MEFYSSPNWQKNVQFQFLSHVTSSTALPNSLKEVTSNVVNGSDKIASNGNDKLANCESTVPNLTTGLFVAHQLNDSTKNTAWNVNV